MERETGSGRVAGLPDYMLFNLWEGLVHYYLANGDLFAPEGNVIGRYGGTLIESYLHLIEKGGERRTAEMSENTSKTLKGRSCYGHLGGTLGDRLFERLVELGWFERDGNKRTVYSLTERGREALLQLGVDINERR